jgi:hypothetical protein
LKSFKGLHWKTKIELVNFFIKKNKLKNENQYNNLTSKSTHNWLNVNLTSFKSILNHLNNDSNLENLILCRPENALQTEKNIINSLGLIDPLSQEVKIFIKKIIDYSIFDKYAYQISSDLNVNTCPYCNRNYINTVIDKKGDQIIRPTFDHFLPKNLHPFLSLSFYNLIPSCYYCNSSVKGSDDVSIGTHIHPYKEGFDNEATFNVIIKNFKNDKSDPGNYKLIFSNNINPILSPQKYRKIFGGSPTSKNLKEGNINLFKLEEIYQSHLDIVSELVIKCDKLNSTYASSLQSLFSSLSTSKEEFYQFYFGNYFDEKNFNRRPMAKLSKDIVSQILPSFVKLKH